MKTKQFYSFLVETTDITLELGDLNLTSKERVHLISLVDANIHASVIKVVLESLETENKKIFLKNLTEGNHDKTLKHLEANIKNVQSKIKNSIKETLKELKRDIKNVKTKD